MKTSEAKTERAALEAREEGNRLQANDEIPEERSRLERKYEVALHAGDRTEAKRLKLALAELDAEAEMLADEAKRLHSQWPRIRKQEAKEKIPGLLKSYSAAVDTLSRTSAEAERNFWKGLSQLEAVVQTRKECMTLLETLRVQAAEAGESLPDIPSVPARFNQHLIINSIGRIKTVCS